MPTNFLFQVNQVVADRARKQLTEAQKYHADHEDFLAGPLAKEAAEFHVAAIRFLNTEADVGLDLAHLAAKSRDAKKRVRNRRHAREAYDSLLKRLDGAAPTEGELKVLQAETGDTPRAAQIVGRTALGRPLADSVKRLLQGLPR